MQITNTVWDTNENGEWIITSQETIEIPVDEIIKDKEAKLLELYEEIQKLKATSETNSN
jgi:hypothetical protein